MKIKELISGKHLIWLGLIAGILLVAFILLSDPDQPPQPTKKRAEVNLLGNTDLEKENWRATAEKDLETLRTQQKEIAEQLKGMADQMKHSSSKAQSVPKDFPPMPPLPSFNLNPPPDKPRPTGAPQVRPDPQKPAGLPRSIRVFLPEAGTSPVNNLAGAKTEDPDRNYLPSGSFIPGLLLSGLDAPAGVNSSREPHPVLIQLSDLAVLPNRFRFDVRECRIIGEGYGEISSERAYIRTTSLSCVRNDGSSIDVPLKGFVAGEDGKNGLRGRVVSKEGQIIAKALLAGFAEGISKAFSASATTVSVSPLGVTQTVDPDRALEMGALTGVSRSADRLSQYYIRMAERIFPVIEIDAGRKIDIVVLQGRALQPIEEKTK